MLARSLFSLLIVVVSMVTGENNTEIYKRVLKIPNKVFDGVSDNCIKIIIIIIITKKRVNKLCLLNTLRHLTVYYKNYFFAIKCLHTNIQWMYIMYA